MRGSLRRTAVMRALRAQMQVAQGQFATTAFEAVLCIARQLDVDIVYHPGDQCRALRLVAAESEPDI